MNLKRCIAFFREPFSKDAPNIASTCDCRSSMIVDVLKAALCTFCMYADWHLIRVIFSIFLVALEKPVRLSRR